MKAFKEQNMQTDTNVRGKQQSTPQSNPRDSEGTIMDHMMSILELVEENKRLSKGDKK